MPAHYFLGGQLVGSGGISWWDALTPASSSFVLVCPACGDVWGRVLDDRCPGDWLPLRRSCPRHLGFIDRVPGSFLPPWPVPLAQYPHSVLRREFLLAFSHLVMKGTP
jgi:hypothetical protein